ncbi:MAG: hypothetical protein U9N87_08150, partial [Planctomycetota bacterium]|nr:hypothetical protein [Planctomycetota bacterium]
MSKRILCVVLALVLAGTARAEQISLITDTSFDRGFVVFAPEHPPTVQGNLQWDTSGGPPVWDLAQWASQSTIWGVTPTQLPSGAWRYANADKEIIVGGGPSAGESDLVLTINGVNEYGGQFRGSSDPWPHLLVAQRISDPGGQIGSQSPSIADMTSLDFQIDARLLYDNRTLTAGYDPSIHASQYNIFYTVQNLNTASAGYGDFLWFGTALYDDREDVTGRHVMIDEFTQKLIYSIGIENFTSEHIADGNWMSVSGDLLPHMKAALDTAWSNGILLDSQDYADYRIGGVNMGWEMMGLNDASMQIRNYNVVANVGAPSFPPFQDDATTRGLWHMDQIDNLGGGAPYQDFIDDDNTYGAPDRAGGRELLLGLPGASSHPTLTPGAAGMGDALLFDGVDDVALGYNVWDVGADHASIDFLMRPDGLPDLNGDNFMAIAGVLPLQVYLRDDGSGMGNLVAMAFNEYGNPLYGFSQGGLELGQWHEAHVEVTNTGG